MLISSNPNVDTMVNKTSVTEIISTSTMQNTKTPSLSDSKSVIESNQQSVDKSEETKMKVQKIVGKFNEMLEISNNTSKFMYHEGLDRYYVTVVNSETDEVVKEIPPKKLLDAYYEMQKMLGMIVDEKI